MKAITDNGGLAIAIQGDVAKEVDIVKLFEKTKMTFGTLDILVNNAGIYQFAPIEEVSVESFHQHFNINVLGTLLAIRESLKYFSDKGGNIINISAAASNLPLAEGSIYSATKAAVDSITISLSKELGPKNIRINSILPGGVETERAHSSGVVGSDFEKRMVANTLLGRVGHPEDIAKVALFLASDDSGWITGEKIAVSGGLYGM